MSQMLTEPAFSTSSAIREANTGVPSAGDLTKQFENLLNEGEKGVDHLPWNGGDNSPCKDLDTQILNKSLQSIFSQELDESEMAASDKGDATITNKPECVISSQSETSNKSQQPCVEESAESVNSRSQSPNLSLIPTVAENKRRSSQQSRGKKRKKVRANMLDDIIGLVSKVETTAIKPPQKPLPTSTPLRKSGLCLEGKNLQVQADDGDAQRKRVIVNETRDSGFPTEMHTVALGRNSRPLKELSDTSVIFNSSLQNSRLTTDSCVTPSQTLRILVQWKSRTLLIPVARWVSHVNKFGISKSACNSALWKLRVG